MWEVKTEAGSHKGNVADINEVERPTRSFPLTAPAAAANRVPEQRRLGCQSWQHCKSCTRPPHPLLVWKQPSETLCFAQGSVQSRSNYVSVRSCEPPEQVGLGRFVHKRKRQQSPREKPRVARLSLPSPHNVQLVFPPSTRPSSPLPSLSGSGSGALPPDSGAHLPKENESHCEVMC